MKDLVDKLNTALAARERAIEGTGILGWLTYLQPDGSMAYTTAAGIQPLDEPHWCVDGKEAVGWASARIVYSEDQERRRVAAHRKILEEHREDEAFPGFCWGCGWIPDGYHFVSKIDKCPILLALAEEYDLTEGPSAEWLAAWDRQRV